MRLLPFLDRAAGAMGAVQTPKQALPGPQGLVAYARLRFTGAELPQRLRLLVGHLTAIRSGCQWCADRNRHLALQAGVAPGDVDAVTQYASIPGYSGPERAALALADAITRFSETDGGFSQTILLQARRHFSEPEIMAVVTTVTTEHFFDARTGRMGQDAMAIEPNRGR